MITGIRGYFPGGLSRMGQLSKHKEGLERENEKLLGEVSHLTQKLNNALEYQNELERKTSMGDMKINELAGQLEVFLI